MPLSTILQLYCGGQFYWWRKPEYPKKTKVSQYLQDLSFKICIQTYVHILYGVGELINFQILPRQGKLVFINIL